MKKIIVIGGGASGMVAAIHAKESDNEVLLLEKNDRIGKKILATGNGKCNLGNRNLKRECYYTGDPEFVDRVLKQYDTSGTISFFESIGLKIRDKNGYLYPYSEQAAAVLDVLRMELARRQVKIKCDTRIIRCRKELRKGYRLEAQDGTVYYADAVILACGTPASLKKEGRDGYMMAKELGLPVTDLVPGLVQLRTKDPMQKAMAGVRCQMRLQLWIDDALSATEQGELQLTEYGISGIPVFQISRIAAYALKKHQKVSVHIDFAPDYTQEELLGYLYRQRKMRREQTAEELQTGLLHKKLNQVFLKQCGIKASMKNAEINDRMLKKLAVLYKCYEMEIAEVNPLEQAQVCAGGIPLYVLNEHMEVIRHKGFFITGELLDVDGICGGYNLHWAFATGTIAGKAAKR